MKTIEAPDDLKRRSIAFGVLGAMQVEWIYLGELPWPRNDRSIGLCTHGPVAARLDDRRLDPIGSRLELIAFFDFLLPGAAELHSIFIAQCPECRRVLWADRPRDRDGKSVYDQ
jgi:hypothetical protein